MTAQSRCESTNGSGESASAVAQSPDSPTSAATGERPQTDPAPVAADGDAAATGGEPDPDACAKCGEYLDSLARLKAEFANFRRRAAEQQAQAAERGAADLATRLLEVLDATEAGAAHHGDVVGPLHNTLVEALRAVGLEVISPEGEPFDPRYHEAVAHETGDDSGPPVVTDVLRTGYAWSGRVLRPEVVGVRG